MPTYFLGKILSSDLVTAHIRLKSSKNVESERWLVPIKSQGMVVSCVDLWLEGACQGLGNHYQILGLKLGLTLTLAITHPQDTEHES